MIVEYGPVGKTNCVAVGMFADIHRVSFAPVWMALCADSSFIRPYSGQLPPQIENATGYDEGHGSRSESHAALPSRNYCICLNISASSLLSTF